MFRLLQIFHLLQVVISSQYQVHPGSIFENIGETKFVHSYLDLKFDLSCFYNVSTISIFKFLSYFDYIITKSYF